MQQLQRKHTAAEQTLERLLEKQPASKWGAQRLSSLRLNTGNAYGALKAIEAYEAATPVPLRHPKMQLGKALALSQLKRYKELAALADTLKNLEDRAPAVEYVKALALFYAGEPQTALLRLENLMNAGYRYNETAPLAIESALRAGETQKALQLTQRADIRKKLPELAAANELRVLQQMSRLEEAVRQGEAWLEEHSDWPALHAALSTLYQAQGRNKAAFERIMQATVLAPADAEYAYQKGVLLLKLQNFQEAIRVFTKVIALEPKSARAYAQRSFAKTMLQDWLGTTLDIDKAEKLDNQDPIVLRNRGFLLFAQENPAPALEHFRRAEAIAPGLEWNRFYMGLSYNALGQDSEAIEALDRAARAGETYARVKLSELYDITR